MTGQTTHADRVTLQKVSFPHGQHQVVGNLFLPPTFDETTTYAAVVATHPFGRVKEQTSGLYARHLAEHGYIALAYDASHYGESGGEPRLYEVPATGSKISGARSTSSASTRRSTPPGSGPWASPPAVGAPRTPPRPTCGSGRSRRSALSTWVRHGVRACPGA